MKTGEQIPAVNRFNIDQQEFGLVQGCIMRGMRFVVLQALRKIVLNELHIGHFGITKMKLLARSYCWWPGIDLDIGTLVEDCYSCNKVRNEPSKTIHMWDRPTAPFQRVHADFAGPFQNHYFFILIGVLKMARNKRND